MSYCISKGKDKIIFATEEYLLSPSKVELGPDDPNDIDTSNQGAILPNGDINWDCPCLGNMPNGPCGPSFRESFKCFADYKHDDNLFQEKCYSLFVSWEECMNRFKKIYRPEEDNASAPTTSPQTPPTNTSANVSEVTKEPIKSNEQTNK